MHENAELLTLLPSVPLAPRRRFSFYPSRDVLVPRERFPLASGRGVPPVRFGLARLSPSVPPSLPSPRRLAPALGPPTTDPLISISIPLAETGVPLSAPIWNFFAGLTPYVIVAVERRWCLALAGRSRDRYLRATARNWYASGRAERQLTRVPFPASIS